MERKTKYKLIILDSFAESEQVKLEIFNRIIDEIGIDVTILKYEQSLDISDYVRKATADILMTFDLTGFERSTLAGGISYNLLPCKQIHVITEKNLPNEKYLSNQLSMSMFFYCIGREYYDYLIRKYPDIPYLKVVKRLEEEEKMGITKKSDILCEIIAEVMKICHME